MEGRYPCPLDPTHKATVLKFNMARHIISKHSVDEVVAAGVRIDRTALITQKHGWARDYFSKLITDGLLVEEKLPMVILREPWKYPMAQGTRWEPKAEYFLSELIDKENIGEMTV